MIVFSIELGVELSAAAAKANATVACPEGKEEREYFKPLNKLKFMESFV